MGRARSGVRVVLSLGGERGEAVPSRAVRRENRVSVQGKLDDAAQNEDEQRGGDQQIQRIAHSSQSLACQCCNASHLAEDEKVGSEAIMWDSQRSESNACATRGG
jgi:hypothetical protein